MPYMARILVSFIVNDSVSSCCSLVVLTLVATPFFLRKAHRDLKPDNICLSSIYGDAKIIDTGLIRDVAEGHGTRGLSTRVGTPWYTPPFGASKTHDEYSTGMILCQLICGKIPFNMPYEREFTGENAKKALENDLYRQSGLSNSLGLDSQELRLLFSLIVGFLEPNNEKRMNYIQGLGQVKELNRRITAWKGGSLG